MVGPEGRSPQVRAAIAVAAAIAIVLSVFLPWVDAGFDQNSVAYNGLSFPPVAIAELLAAGMLIVLASSAGVLHRSDLAQLAAVTAVLAFAFSAPMIVILETVSSALPTSFLPATLRRASVELSAGLGLWLAAGGGAVAAAAMSGWRMRPIEPGLWIIRGNRAWGLASLALLTLTALAGWLRYQTWLGTSATGEHVVVPGWASPWLGPLSLFSIWLLVAALVLAILARTELAGLLAAAAGWLLTFIAALAIIAAQSISDLSDLAAGSVSQDGSGFHATGAVWAVFLIGLSAAAVGGCLVCLRPNTSALPPD